MAQSENNEFPVGRDLLTKRVMKKAPKDAAHHKQFVASLNASGWDMTDLAREIEKPKDFVRDYVVLRKASIGHVELQKLEALLNQRPRKSDVTHSIAGEIEVARTPSRMRLDATQIFDVPVYSGAEGGDGTMTISEGVVIDFAERTSDLTNVKEAFAVLVYGTSMDPEFEPGNLAIVNPDLPIVNDQTYIFCSDEASSSFRAVIKRLVRQTDETWVVRQHRPDRQYEIMKADFPRAMRVTGKRYR